jgi:Type I restriction enzyme R protein N terminus (HSDR_N)
MTELLAGPPPGRPYVSEEDAKIRWIVPLLEEFGHDRDRDMSFEVPVRWEAGGTTQEGRADIVVYVGDIPIIVVETKKPGLTLERAKRQAVTYAKAYSPIVPFVVAHDTDRVRLYRASAKPGRIGEYVLVDDFPTRSELLTLIGLAEEAPTAVPEREEAISRIVVSQHYRDVLADCVRLVLNTSSLEGVAAVSELAKVLLAKQHHENRETGRFQPGASIGPLFDEAKADLPGLFRAGERIQLDRTTFDAVASRLAEVEA